MRPGQEAPDESEIQEAGNIPRVASMRPGQEAPDECKNYSNVIHAIIASMRPGQEAPDESVVMPGSGGELERFNEAGARSPG